MLHVDYAPKVTNADYAKILNTDPIVSSGVNKGQINKRATKLQAFPISILILHSGTLSLGIYAMYATTCPDIQRYLREPDIKLEVVPK